MKQDSKNNNHRTNLNKAKQVTVQMQLIWRKQRNSKLAVGQLGF